MGIPDRIASTDIAGVARWIVEPSVARFQLDSTVWKQYEAGDQPNMSELAKDIASSADPTEHMTENMAESLCTFVCQLWEDESIPVEDRPIAPITNSVLILFAAAEGLPGSTGGLLENHLHHLNHNLLLDEKGVGLLADRGCTLNFGEEVATYSEDGLNPMITSEAELRETIGQVCEHLRGMLTDEQIATVRAVGNDMKLATNYDPCPAFETGVLVLSVISAVTAASFVPEGGLKFNFEVYCIALDRRTPGEIFSDNIF